uniref:recombinase family protein n=1 Tax=Enterococcus faecalis TaxID=1351 RepID=UPI00359CAE05
MAKIGYIRVSSQDQNLDRQVAMLNQLKIDKLFQEKTSGKEGRPTEYAPNSKKPQKRLVYQTVVKQLKQGDTVAEIAT